MAGDKRILVFSMAGGTGRSYHADLGCGNTRAAYPLSAGAGLAGRPGDPGPGPHPSDAPGLGPPVPASDHRCEGRAALHRHHCPASRQPRRHHPGPERFADRYGRRRCHPVPGQRQSGKPLRQGGAAPVLHRAVARQHCGLVHGPLRGRHRTQADLGRLAQGRPAADAPVPQPPVGPCPSPSRTSCSPS